MTHQEFDELRPAAFAIAYRMALVRTALDVTRDRAPMVLDVGAGTGHRLDALPHAQGIAFDASRAALRHAARAHPRIAAVAGDVWHGVPLRDASVDLVTNVFAPRNPFEFTRVTKPGRNLVIVTPTTGHLRELAMLHSMRIHSGRASNFTVSSSRNFTERVCNGSLGLAERKPSGSSKVPGRPTVPPSPW